MKTTDADRARKQYRMRLLEALHQAALKRGLYTDILPPEPPEPESEFRLVVDDMLFLMGQLPVPSSDDVAAEMIERIKPLLDGCRTEVMGKLTPQEVYSIMRLAYRRATGKKGPTHLPASADPVKIQAHMLRFVPGGLDEITSL